MILGAFLMGLPPSSPRGRPLQKGSGIKEGDVLYKREEVLCMYFV